MSTRVSALTCPHCGNTTPDIAGHEVRGVYDGVLFWSCDECLRAWSRDWTGFGRRQEIADTHVQKWNDNVMALDMWREARR